MRWLRWRKHRASLGVFTSLGSAHQEGFASLEEKLEEKLRLFERSTSLFYSLDTPLVAEAMRERFPTKSHYTWSHKDPAATVYVRTLRRRAPRQHSSAWWLAKNIR